MEEQTTYIVIVDDKQITDICFESYNDAFDCAKRVRDNFNYTTTLYKKEIMIVNKFEKTLDNADC